MEKHSSRDQIYVQCTTCVVYVSMKLLGYFISPGAKKSRGISKQIITSFTNETVFQTVFSIADMLK